MHTGNIDDFSSTFSIKSTKSEIIYISKDIIVAKQIVSDSITKYRKISINNQHLLLEDLVCGGAIQSNFVRLNYSPSYGVLNEQ
jgi:phosphoribosylaminoimidazole (AIR) synthetase